MEKIMKTFSQLNYNEKNKAIQYCLNELIFGIVENRIYFEEESEIQKSINTLVDYLERKQTPWFLGEYIFNNSFLNKQLSIIAKSNAMECLYPDQGEIIPRYVLL